MPADHLLVLGRTLLQADLVAVGLHRHPGGVLLPTGDGTSWCSRLCERLLAVPPAEPLTLVEDLQCSAGCVGSPCFLHCLVAKLFNSHLSGALCRFERFAEAADSPEARFFCCHVLISSDGEEELGLLCAPQPPLCLAHVTISAEALCVTVRGHAGAWVAASRGRRIKGRAAF